MSAPGSLFQFLRLWVAKTFLPDGYAIWTWDDESYDLDEPILVKAPRDA